MKSSSAKAKGRRLQDYTRFRVLETFTELEEDDVKCAIMGESGEDLHLSPAARKLIPFSIECKNQERLNIWSAFEQAKGHGKYPPLLVFKRNRSEVLVTLTFDDLLTMLWEVSR